MCGDQRSTLFRLLKIPEHVGVMVDVYLYLLSTVTSIFYTPVYKLYVRKTKSQKAVRKGYLNFIHVFFRFFFTAVRIQHLAHTWYTAHDQTIAVNTR